MLGEHISVLGSPPICKTVCKILNSSIITPLCCESDVSRVSEKKNALCLCSCEDTANHASPGRYDEPANGLTIKQSFSFIDSFTPLEANEWRVFSLQDDRQVIF